MSLIKGMIRKDEALEAESHEEKSKTDSIQRGEQKQNITTR